MVALSLTAATATALALGCAVCPPRARTPIAAAAAPGSAAARRVNVDLGKGKSTKVMVPVLQEDPTAAELATMSTDKMFEEYGHLTGAGDIVWPAGLALSRLLAHCPSFVADHSVVELGCGLGAVGLTAAASGAASVLLTDYDEAVLELAAAGAAENGVEAKVNTAQLDWTSSDAATALPGQPFSLVLAADVLYDQQGAVNVAKLLPALLPPESGAKCLISDLVQRPWRELFEQECAKGGLAVAAMPLPGPEDALLLSVQRA